MSPRRRAQRTLELLDVGCHDRLPGHGQWSARPGSDFMAQTKVQVEPDIQEWDYGDYEGLTSKTIREQRRERGEKDGWDIWRDGCPGGEYV